MTKKDKSNQKTEKSEQKPAISAKNETKNALIDYTSKLSSLGNLQQVIVRNIQKELENI